MLAGYPLLLAAWGRLRPKPVRKHFEPKTVTVLLTVYNGEKWIQRKLESLLALDYPHDRLEILVISDGSTDHTEAIVEQFSGEGGVIANAARR